MEEKNESEKSELFLSNISSVKEENEESSFKSHTSRRTRSLGKILYSKTSKSIKKHFIQNNILSLNIKNSISTPRLQDAFKVPKASISDYEILYDLGEGSYGNVVLAKSKIDGKKFAIKVIKKDLLNRFDKQYEIHVEKYCLIHLSHPNIIKFNKTFQDKHHLYFVLEYCKNKDLGKLIQKVGTFNHKLAQYYAAEIISVISFMRKRGIYHRDLKPENIGVDEDMHLKLLDFATSNMEGKYFDKKIMNFLEIEKGEYEEALNKIKKEKNIKDGEPVEYVVINGHKIMNLKEKFVGTPEYIAPEVLEGKYDLIGPGVDIWAFGVMLYLFYAGQTPFKGKNDEETLDNIRKLNYSWEIVKKHETHNINIPNEAKDLIQKILVKDPKQRIGYGSKDYKEIKSHPYFKGINFDNLPEEPIPLNKCFSLLESLGYIDNKDFEEEKDDDIYINVLNKSNDQVLDDQLSSGSMDNAELRTSFKKLTYDKLENFKLGFFHKAQTKEIKESKETNMIIENDFNENKITIFNDFKNQNKIDKSDEVLIEDVLYKKTPFIFHYNKRYVKLFAKGNLNYYLYPTKVLKGSIIINENTKVEPIDDFRFKLMNQNKIYRFKNYYKRITDDWVENINKVILDKIKMSKNKK